MWFGDTVVDTETDTSLTYPLYELGLSWDSPNPTPSQHGHLEWKSNDFAIYGHSGGTQFMQTPRWTVRGIYVFLVGYIYIYIPHIFLGPSIRCGPCDQKNLFNNQ